MPNGSSSDINVAGFDYFNAISSMLPPMLSSQLGVHTLTWYLRWQQIHYLGPFLFQNVREEHFNFFGRILRGQVLMPPW